MKVEHKIGIVFLGLIFLLFPIIGIFYTHNKNIIIQEHLNKQHIIANNISKYISISLKDKARIASTLASSKIIIDSLKSSNSYYKNLQDHKKEIVSKNREWITTRVKGSALIDDILSSDVSKYLKKQKKVIPGYYGEIFLTNSYGAVIGSTDVLSTFKHDHKYWWKNSYNSGKGSVYYDDRGYDLSSGEYVLGVVVPVMEEGKILGILKSNIKIDKLLKDIVVGFDNYSNISIIRSSGLVVMQKDVEPLSKKVDDNIYKDIDALQKSAIILGNNIASLSSIKFTKNSNIFGGNEYESIDHKFGNKKNEFWYVLITENIDTFLYKSLSNTVNMTIIMILIVTIILSFIYLYISKSLSKPLAKLIDTMSKSHKEYHKADISSPISEIEFLAKTYNSMIDKITKKEEEVKQKHERIVKLLSDLDEKRKEQLKQVLNSALDGIQAFKAIRDSSGKIVDFKYIFSNKKACEIVGYTEEQLLQSTMLSILPSHKDKLISLEDRSLFEIYCEIVESGEAKELQFYFEHDGIKDWFANKSVKLEDGFVVTFSVITDEIEQKNIMATQSRLATMGEMISLIAHQWRQPIATIMGVMANINDMIEFDEFDKDKTRVYLETVEDTLIFMSKTIDDFRNFFNNEKIKERFNIIECIINTNNVIHAQLINHNIETELYIKDSHGMIVKELIDKNILNRYDLHIDGFANELQQVLLNLMSNAKDALLLSDKDRVIKIEIDDSDKDILTISVEDNASGISEDNLLRVFEPYFTTKKELQGTGLGLYMSKMIVEDSLNGKIYIKSKVDIGTKVYIQLNKKGK
jgi:signal transduction histidine kinase